MTRLTVLAKTKYNALLKQLYIAGIEAVSEKNWAILQSTAELIEQPAFTLLKVREHIAELKKKLREKLPQFNAQSYREMICWMRLTQSNYREWQAKQIKSLNDPFWWHERFEQIKKLPSEQQPKARHTLEALQKTWMDQNAYAHYSTLDMIHVYETVVPVFSTWLNQAKAEFKKRGSHLVPRLKQAYQKYLTWFEEALSQEKSLLRNSLQTRLAIGVKKGYGAWDNVIEAIRGEIKAIGALPREPKLEATLAHGYLTPQTFVAIQKIIEQEGSIEEKMALHALPYYRLAFDNHKKEDGHYNTEFGDQRSRSDAMSIKSTVYYYLPSFLKWLFWDSQVQEEFFTHPNSAFLQAQEIAFLNAKVDVSTATIETLCVHPVWKQSYMCSTLIIDEMQRVQTWLKHPLAFLFPESVQQLKHYEASLKNSAEAWFTKLLELFKQVIKIEKNGVLTKNGHVVLGNAFIQLNALQDQSLYSCKAKEELASLEQRYQSLCQSDGASALSMDRAKRMTIPFDKPLWELFKDTLLHVITLFEMNEDNPNSTVQMLKAQLEMVASLDDKTFIYLCVLDWLKNSDDLPQPLRKSLQAILKKPEFSLDALTQSSQQSVLSNSASLSLAPKTASSSKLNLTRAPFDEDPWSYTEDQLVQHGEAIKVFATKACLTQALCRYTIRFLKHINALQCWDHFVSHREKIAFVLGTLAETGTSFSALRQELKETAKTVRALTQDSWDTFKEFNIGLQISILEAFLSKDIAASQEAASYVSQKELGFLRTPPHSESSGDVSSSTLPAHTF